MVLTKKGLRDTGRALIFVTRQRRDLVFLPSTCCIYRFFPLFFWDLLFISAVRRNVVYMCYCFSCFPACKFTGEGIKRMVKKPLTENSVTTTWFAQETIIPEEWTKFVMMRANLAGIYYHLPQISTKKSIVES